MNNVKDKVFSNLIWRLAERYAAQIVQFIVSIVLARILLPEIYGVVALVTVFITILQVFIDSGFGSALIQKKDADDLDFSTVFYFNVALCVVLYTLIFFLAPLIAKFYNNEQLTLIIRVLSLSIVFSSLKNVQQAYVSRNMQFKKFFLATSIGTAISAVVGIWMALKGYGVWSIVAQNLTNLSIDTLLLWITVKWRPKWQFSFQRLKILFRYGWKLLASSLIDCLYNNIRQLIIGKKYTTTDLAYYNKAHQFPQLIVTNINTSIDSVLFPVLSQEQENKEVIKVMTRRSIKTATYIMAPLMVGLAVVASGVVTLVLTPKWLFCVPFLQIFCISYLFYPIHTANLNAIKAMGRSDIYLKLEITKKSIGMALLLGSMWFGVKAIALSLLVSSLISIVINSFPNKKLLGYSLIEQIKDMLPNILLALFMGVCVYALSFISIHYIAKLFIQVMVGGLIYIGTSAIMKNETFIYLFDIVKGFFKKDKENK